MAKPKQAAALFEQLDKAIQGGEGDELAGKMKVGRPCYRLLNLGRAAVACCAAKGWQRLRWLVCDRQRTVAQLCSRGCLQMVGAGPCT